MNRLFFLLPLFLLACSKDHRNPADSNKFQHLQNQMWKEDSIIFLETNGRREVSIPPTMHAQYAKFTATQLQYYFSFNREAPIFLESHVLSYKHPNKVEVWYPARTGGPPDYKIEVDSVSDTHLRCSYFHSPDYIKTREYYYSAY